MLARWKILHTRNNSLIIDLSEEEEEEEEEMNDHYRGYRTGRTVRRKEVIYWPHFVTRRRRLCNLPV
jgi:hypothetical protein